MTQITLPAVRPNLDRLLDVALETAGETQRFDFKECLRLTDDEHRLRLVKAAGAFTNTEEGGFVLIGISDQREVVGLDDVVADAFEQTKLHQLLAQYLAPAPVVQVRQHRRDGKRLVVIEIDPFADVPSVLRQSATFGKEKVVAGSFLFRTKGAQSGVLVVETDVRALCDAIVRRRASAFLDLVRRGGIGLVGQSSSGDFAALDELRALADEEWSSAPGTQPYLEVAFAPRHPLDLAGKALEEAVRASSVGIRHGFPFLHVDGYQVEGPVLWGWYGRIPFGHWGAGSEPPSYLWAAARTGAFVDREGFWEDSQGSVIPGGAGAYHVIGRIILLLRFCEAFLARVQAGPGTLLRLAVRANNVQGRYLEDENHPHPEGMLPKCISARVESRVDVSVERLRTEPLEVGLGLAEDLVWQFGRRDWSRHHLEQFFRRAKDFLGPQYTLGSAGAP